MQIKSYDIAQAQQHFPLVSVISLHENAVALARACNAKSNNFNTPSHFSAKHVVRCIVMSILLYSGDTWPVVHNTLALWPSFR